MSQIPLIFVDKKGVVENEGRTITLEELRDLLLSPDKTAALMTRFSVLPGKALSVSVVVSFETD